MPVPMPNFVIGAAGDGPDGDAHDEGRCSAASTSPTIRELLESAQDLGVRLIACQMTMDVFGYTQDDFLDGVEFGGAAAFLAEARQAHVTLFV